jgi:phospholipid/cholesterol/gamma-HCH transport system permease protein
MFIFIFLADIYQAIVKQLRYIGYTFNLFLASGFYFFDLWKRRREFFQQMYISGVKSLGVVSIVAFFTGMILALQTGIEMSKYGTEEYVGVIILNSLVREMGPFMTAIIIAASVGSAISAEIGTMAVSEELDALEVMDINPVRFLVVPRIWALSIMVPVLSVYCDVLGVIGGAIVGKTQLLLDQDVYFKNALDTLDSKDLYVGIFKAFIFGITIGTVSCAQGLRARGGALGVGRATRLTVVQSFLLIIIFGYFITGLFYR